MAKILKHIYNFLFILCVLVVIETHSSFPLTNLFGDYESSVFSLNDNLNNKTIAKEVCFNFGIWKIDNEIFVANDVFLEEYTISCIIKYSKTNDTLHINSANYLTPIDAKVLSNHIIKTNMQIKIIDSCINHCLNLLVSSNNTQICELASIALVGRHDESAIPYLNDYSNYLFEEFIISFFNDSNFIKKEYITKAIKSSKLNGAFILSNNDALSNGFIDNIIDCKPKKDGGGKMHGQQYALNALF